MDFADERALWAWPSRPLLSTLRISTAPAMSEPLLFYQLLESYYDDVKAM
jgi:hypothetical protein